MKAMPGVVYEVGRDVEDPTTHRSNCARQMLRALLSKVPIYYAPKYVVACTGGLVGNPD
jgi:hypothetical protein